MIPDNFKILIEKLKEKTEKKKAIWSKTSRDNEFKLDLGKGAITVDRWEISGVELVDIAIINERGDKIDSIEFSVDDQYDYKYLVGLHTIVKRAYNKVDETFKSILKELEGDKTIGKEKKPDNDDLPF